jgi:hypothetical protein
MAKDKTHTISDVDAAHANTISDPGQLRLFRTAVVTPDYTQVILCKLNMTNGQINMLGTFHLSAADWTTLQARNPTLALAPLSGTNP